MHTKQAATIEEARGLADAIYAEDPSKWPYGIHVDELDDVSIIRSKSAHNKAAGFIGWQYGREPDGSVTGYYSIGILPEFRRQGFAKEAVAKDILLKSASVDQVKAFVVEGNIPSERLAASLGVHVMRDEQVKAASAAGEFLKRLLLGGTARRAMTGAAVGLAATPAENRLLGVKDDSVLGKGNYFGNAAIGLGAGLAHGHPLPQMGLAGTWAAKNTAMLGVHSLEQAADAYKREAPQRQAIADTELTAAKHNADAARQNAANAGSMSPGTKASLALAGILGTGGLGLYAYNSLKSKKPAKTTTTATIHGKEGPVRKKVTINIPAKALPPEFYQSLINADDRRGANMTLTTERTSEE